VRIQLQVAVCILGLLASHPAADSACEYPQGTVAKVSVMITDDRAFASSIVSSDSKVSAKPHESREVREVEYADYYVKVEGSIAKNVRREFSRVRGAVNQVPVTQQSEVAHPWTVSEMEGKHVTFLRPGEDEPLEIVVDGKVSAEWKKRAARLLKPSISAAFICPANAIDGEPWSVPVKALRDYVLNPGGDLMSFTADDNAVEKPFFSRLRVAYWESIEGEVKAVLDPAKKPDGDFLHVTIGGNLSFACSAQFQIGLPRGRRGVERIDIVGSAVWDRKHNRLISIVIDGKSNGKWTDDLLRETPSGIEPVQGETTSRSKMHWRLQCEYN
jgi:hypothetical protein